MSSSATRKFGWNAAGTDLNQLKFRVVSNTGLVLSGFPTKNNFAAEPIFFLAPDWFYSLLTIISKLRMCILGNSVMYYLERF